MFETDTLVDLKIEKLVYEGYGLSHKDGVTFFVEDVCDGDFVTTKITKHKKNIAFAKLENIITPSEHRVPAFCPLHNVCGGCQWQYISYEHQLEAKQKIVDEILTKSLHKNIDIKKILPSPNNKNYRHKIQMPVAQTKNSKRFLIGYYKKHSHDIVNIKFCPIQPKIIDEIIEKIRAYAFETGVTGYNEQKFCGELRHVIFKVSQNSGDILVCFVVNNNKISKQIMDLGSYIFQEFDKIKGININFNQNKNNVILGNKTKNLIGEENYIEKIGDTSYFIGAESFFQVNPESFKNILDTVKDLISKNSNAPKILDAYSGVGSFGLYLSNIAKDVTCVEEVFDACKNAKKACELNNIKNVNVLNGDAQKIFEDLINKKEKFDIVILDPPRKGCSEKSLDYASQLTDRFIIYVSCNPNSLARDIKYLEQYGFELKSAQPVDMFCHTFHVETIAFIEKNPTLE